jgi:hypothetical protein
MEDEPEVPEPFATIPGEVEREHAGTAVVLGPGNGGRDGAARLRPASDQVVVPGKRLSLSHRPPTRPPAIRSMEGERR